MPDSRYFLRRIPPALRREVFDRSQGICQQADCGISITLDTFHCSHLRSANHGGPATLANLAAWCWQCNLKFGNRDALDTRLPLRQWQDLALPELVEALTLQRFATLMAAPGAGKTLMAGRVFDWLLHAGLAHRILVVVHRVTLVSQWRDALRDACHIHLDTSVGTRGYGKELSGMDGLVTTIQSLQNNETVRRYLEAIRNCPTLVILDEVHHLYRLGLWASRSADILGDIETGLNAHVLNMSGTLFRTKPGERIATVDYDQVTNEAGEPRLQAKTDFRIESAELVKQGILRRPNLFRIGATVDVVNLKEGTITTSGIADLTDPEETSAAVRKFHENPACRAALISATLDKLRQMERDSRHASVKALLTAHSIAYARIYAKEIDEQMKLRGLQPLAVCVVSDDRDAHDTLERFRTQRRVGVLCTVGMAGEGYDCPDICVVAYASNTMTEMFIRQVIARGQRVTQWERDQLKRPLSVQVIVPDCPEIVDRFRRVLTPMIQDLDIEEPPPPPPPPPPPIRVQCGTCGTWHSIRRLCPVCHPPTDRVSDIRDPSMDGVTAVADQSAEDYQPDFHEHDPGFIDLLSSALETMQVPGSDAPAVATAIKIVDARRPFDEPFTPPPSSPPPNRPTGTRPLSPREEADRLRFFFNKGIRWVIGQQDGHATQEWISHFVQDVKNAGDIRQLDLATPDQLRRALRYLDGVIRAYCAQTQASPPTDFGAWQ
jgi:superfamily II DNA or RNA helicase